MTFAELYHWPSVGLRVWHAGAVERVTRVYRRDDEVWVLCGLPPLATPQPWGMMLTGGAVPLPQPGEWWAVPGCNPAWVRGTAEGWIALSGAHGSTIVSYAMWPRPWQPVAVRVQSHRLAGYRLPPGAVNCRRPGQWGNLWRVGDPGVPDAAAAVAEYGHALRYALLRADATTMLSEQARNLRRGDLRGRVLACSCAVDAPCHAATLLEIANREQ